jgi:dTMP kinase
LRTAQAGGTAPTVDIEVVESSAATDLNNSEDLPAAAAVAQSMDDDPLTPGKLITFEGCEGTGKSTQIERAARWLNDEGIPFLTTREPGGTPLGKSLRALLLDAERARCTLPTELFLLLADRAQHVSEIIRPSLDEGLVVLCDRYNDSTLAYQGYGSGLDTEILRAVCALAAEGVQPHLTILLDGDPAVTMRRIDRRLDRMEQKGPDFHQRVRKGFLTIAAAEPERIRVLDALQDPDTIALEVQNAIGELLERGL